MEALRMLGRVLIMIAAAALVVVVWYSQAPTIVALLDFNLSAIKFGCAKLPPPYGAMAESALRGALGADKAMLFAEASIAIRFVLWVVWHLFAVGDRSSTRAAATARS